MKFSCERKKDQRMVVTRLFQLNCQFCKFDVFGQSMTEILKIKLCAIAEDNHAVLQEAKHAECLRDISRSFSGCILIYPAAS